MIIKAKIIKPKEKL